MVSKIKSAWTGQQIPQQDNRSKSAAPQTGVSNTVLPASQSGLRPFGPGEAPVTGAASNSYIQQYGQSTMDNVVRQQMGGSYGGPSGSGMPMAPKPVAASMSPQGMPQGGYNWTEKDKAGGLSTLVPPAVKGSASAPEWNGGASSGDPVAPLRSQAEVKAAQNGAPAITTYPYKPSTKDQAEVTSMYGVAKKPSDSVVQASSEVAGMYGEIGNSAQTEAERKAYEILATPTADQAFWDAKAAAQTAEIDRQAAALQRQLQQQVAAGGGGIGGVQIQNMAEVAAQANRAKSEALTALAKEKAYFMLEDKKAVVSLLFQGASLEQQTKLALLQAKMEQEAKNLDFGWTALSAAADFYEKGYNPAGQPEGDQISAAFTTEGTYRDPQTGAVFRIGPDGKYYYVGQN